MTCLQLGCTRYSFLLSVFQLLLHRYSSQDDIIIGTPASNRNHKQIEKLVGMFVNTLPLRSKITGDTTFSQMLETTQKTVVSAQEFQDVPLQKIVNSLPRYEYKLDLEQH